MDFQQTTAYHAKAELVNSTPRIVNGRYVAHAKLSLVERAFLAADLHRGAQQLVACRHAGTVPARAVDLFRECSPEQAWDNSYAIPRA